MNDTQSDIPREPEAVSDTTPPPAEGSAPEAVEQAPEAAPRSPTPPRLVSFPRMNIFTS